MMEDMNNLPPLQTQEEQMLEQIRPFLLDPRENYPEPYYMLEYNGVPFSTLGGIQAISGQKKNGKSFVLTMLMAAILGGENERTRLYLPGLSVPERTITYLGHQPRVLYVDTEMEKLNSAKVLRRVHWLCNWELDEPNDRFSVLWLKNVQKDESEEKQHLKRYRLIKYAIEVLHPDIVFIDGLRDLLKSINDEESGTAILSELATMAEERHMCIWNALHQNPTRANDSDEAKMRGWIGTELGNKVSDTFISIKSKTQNGVTFTVKQQDARGKDIDDWKFIVTDDVGQLGIPRIVSNGANLSSKSKEQTNYDDLGDIREWIEQAKETYEWPMTRSDVKKKVFGAIGGQKNTAKQQADLTAALNMGYLEESTMKGGSGSYMLQPTEEMPF